MAEYVKTGEQQGFVTNFSGETLHGDSLSRPMAPARRMQRAAQPQLEPSSVHPIRFDPERIPAPS